MSEILIEGTLKWFWTDDLARLLADKGRPINPPLDEWLHVPFAVRGIGEPLVVAEALLQEETFAA